MVQMARARAPSITEESLFNMINQIHVIREHECAGLLHRLQNLEDFIIQKKAKLIILDSIASLVRKEFDSRSVQARGDHLSLEASRLKYLADMFRIPVVVTNQITSRVDELVEPSLDVASGGLTAALGNTWAHSVNTRIVLEYTTDLVDSSKMALLNSDHLLRRLHVVKSPIAPYAMVVYSIKTAGPTEVEQNCSDEVVNGGVPRSMTSAVDLCIMGKRGFEIGYKLY